MSSALPLSALAPFRVRSYRFQWLADLATSWAFEMETIILAWYILVETKSVTMLTMFGALQYLGTLLAPVFGVAGHRIGNKKIYCAMRMAYATLATTMMMLTLTGALTPLHVFIIASLMGMDGGFAITLLRRFQSSCEMRCQRVFVRSTIGSGTALNLPYHLRTVRLAVN